ncbi:MAG: alanine racemase [Planctomycetota bacterium]|nr:alanine racemase [Planctomycetota bacterium]
MTRFERLEAAEYELPPSLRDEVLSPALVVHLDRVRENLRRVIAHVGDPDRWRPHVKTTKIPAVFAEIARAGVRHFKCATTREVLYLCRTLREEGVEGADVLLAHLPVGRALQGLGRVAAEHPETSMSVLCEDPDAVLAIPAGVDVFVDVNVGMERTGIPVAEHDAIAAVARAAGNRFRGVHGYDGHLHDGSPAERRAAVFACYDRLHDLVVALIDGGASVGEVITSGTPTFLHALAYVGFDELEGVRHRVSPGTVVYHDLRSEQENPELDLLPAATVLTRVVSHPSANLVTCDAGSKSIAAEAGDPCAFVIGRPELVPQSPNEEHLPLRVTAGERPPRGTVLHLVPLHVCPTVNLAEQALLVDGDDARVVDVSARAHDLLLGVIP